MIGHCGHVASMHHFYPELSNNKVTSVVPKSMETSPEAHHNKRVSGETSHSLFRSQTSVKLFYRPSSPSSTLNYNLDNAPECD